MCLGFVLLASADSDLYAKAETGADNSEQKQNLTIVVNGRTLTGLNSSPQMRSGRLFLPVVSIADALGDSVSVETTSRIVTVRRQNAVAADFNAQTGQVTENGSVVLAVSGAAEIIFPPNPAELTLPAEIVSQLLGVSIRLDETVRAIVVTRDQPQAIARAGARHSIFELHQVEYEYNLNRYASGANQNLILSAGGRIADGRFALLSNLSGAANRPAFRNGTFIFERAGGQKFIGGDFGSGTDLQFMSSTVRGALAQVPVGDFRLTAFGGRSNSGAFFPLPVEPLVSRFPLKKRNGLQYDTNIVGAYASFGSSPNKRRPNPFTLSSGVMRFDAPMRKGLMLAAGTQYAFNRLRLQADAAIGKFSGFRQDNTQVEGFDAAADVSATLQLLDNLSFQGRFTYVGAKFFSPQSGQHEPVKLSAGGVAWQPKKWLAASFSGSSSVRPGNDGSQRDRFITGTLNLTPRALPKIFFSHTASSTPQIRRAAFTLLNASKDFSRWRLFTNATRIKTVGAASVNAQFGANFRINESNALEASQSFGSGGTLSGLVDWKTANLFARRLNLSAGFGYARNSASSITTSERISATLRLPRQNLLQVSYLQTNAGPTLLVSLRGTLFKKRQADTVLGAPVSEINSYGSFSGRVYQDVNLNGKFDAGVDQPQANVKVRVDGSCYVESDANGIFKIEGVKIGERQVNLDLLSVRADLTLLDGAGQKVTLLSGRDAVVDFRLVRTGRITGTIWLDANENGKFDEGEQALSDVRVVTGSWRDTLTDANGAFIIGDLPPGEYVILIDEKTLPEKTKSALASLSVKVVAGRETGDLNLPVIFIPPEIKRFTASKSSE